MYTLSLYIYTYMSRTRGTPPPAQTISTFQFTLTNSSTILNACGFQNFLVWKRGLQVILQKNETVVSTVRIV